MKLYARKTPTNDPVFNNWLNKNLLSRYKAALGVAPYYDVELSNDENFNDIKCRIRWDKSFKPDKRHKYFTLNCYKCRLEWV